jgi:short-subunit dehydrogenase
MWADVGGVAAAAGTALEDAQREFVGSAHSAGAHPDKRRFLRNKRKDLAKVEAVLRTDKRITTLVNDAGVGSTAPVLQADLDKMSEMIALNIDALTRLTYAAVPGFVERNGGTIINITSVVALAPWIFNGVYSASKAFVLAFKAC